MCKAALSLAVRLQQFAKLLVQLIELGRDHVLTIRLVRIISIVLLVIIFGFVELPQRFQTW